MHFGTEEMKHRMLALSNNALYLVSSSSDEAKKLLVTHAYLPYICLDYIHVRFFFF